ncbi:carboxylating nicotinate-nucleotide diphosphorylase [Candidatus Peregrinibacteria bacterium]|nr:carboxylating nicotinate-nucleotide diphosphorylase [Candidatus Peregrinibacteria bacterium]MBT4055695.1 carboxylating nicotinate-nucleotide diphosphorylase [Candidatus Peregrinibacteria bacterium]
MDRVALRHFTHNAKDFLTVTKNDYKQWVFRYTFLELDKDLGESGDITTDSVVDGGMKTARVVVEEDGVVAGLEEVKYFLVDSDPRFRPRVGNFELKFLKEDGDKVSSGDIVCEITADVRDILKVERVVLNLLMRMSGVATLTRRYVDMVGDDVLLTPTRKTLWGWLDKKACVLGGGGTHRLNLSDAVMVKDNHLDVLGGSASNAMKKISEANVDARFVEIEVESKEGAVKAAEALVNFASDTPLCVLLDNMKPDEAKSAIDAVREAGYLDQVLVEASGGITEKNLVEYAKTGVDIISMGSLTMPGDALSLKMEF